MSENTHESFHQLKIFPTQVLQIIPDTTKSKEVFDCSYIGCLGEEAVIITAPPEGDFPNIVEGQQVQIRVPLPDGIAFFSSIALFITDVPAYMIYLDYPGSVAFHRVRNAKRVSVNMPVLVSRLKSTNHLDAQITDISMTGAAITSKKPIGRVGQDVVIRGKFRVGTIQRLLSIQAIVRKAEEVSENEYLFGLEFLEDNEDDLLVLFGYIFNALVDGDASPVN